jgi:hypothetical protein
LCKKNKKNLVKTFLVLDYFRLINDHFYLVSTKIYNNLLNLALFLKIKTKLKYKCSTMLTWKKRKLSKTNLIAKEEVIKKRGKRFHFTIILVVNLYVTRKSSVRNFYMIFNLIN